MVGESQRDGHSFLVVVLEGGSRLVNGYASEPIHHLPG